jgi:hypothetical protein
MFCQNSCLRDQKTKIGLFRETIDVAGCMRRRKRKSEKTKIGICFAKQVALIEGNLIGGGVYYTFWLDNKWSEFIPISGNPPRTIELACGWAIIMS